MYLALDVGNSQIHGGIITDSGDLKLDFRINSKQGWSSDQIGVMLKTIIRERNVELGEIEAIAISSVVPSLDHHLKNASIKYFGITPFFIKTGIKTGIIVNKFQNPSEIGADLIASAIYGVHHYKNQNLLIVDLGTATTIIAINSIKEFLGGIIMPGLNTQLSSLLSSAEKLSATEISKPNAIIGTTTSHCIKSGIFHGNVGALKYLLDAAAKEQFKGQEYRVIATGGFTKLFDAEDLFDDVITDLVLQGTVLAYRHNS